MVSAADFPYLWGGGHEQPARFGPFDCSGSVSYVLQQAGYTVPTIASGDIPSWQFPAGPGRVTIFYNATHTFMRIGNRYFGTSTSPARAAAPAGSAPTGSRRATWPTSTRSTCRELGDNAFAAAAPRRRAAERRAAHRAPHASGRRRASLRCRAQTSPLRLQFALSRYLATPRAGAEWTPWRAPRGSLRRHSRSSSTARWRSSTRRRPAPASTSRRARPRGARARPCSRPAARPRHRRPRTARLRGRAAVADRGRSRRRPGARPRLIAALERRPGCPGGRPRTRAALDRAPARAARRRWPSRCGSRLLLAFLGARSVGLWIPADGGRADRRLPRRRPRRRPRAPPRDAARLLARRRRVAMSRRRRRSALRDRAARPPPAALVAAGVTAPAATPSC